MPADYKAKEMIVMRKDLNMRKGKIAAQAGHACVTATLQALISHGLLDYVTREGSAIRIASKKRHVPLIDWFNQGTAKICVYVNSKEELLQIYQEGKRRGFIVSLICDAGFTEFHGEPTYTCIGFEPLYPADIDPITGDLPLY